MDDPHRVGFTQAVADLDQQLNRAGGRQMTFLLQEQIQRAALDKLHRQKRLLGRGLAEVEDPHHVGTLELADQLGLALEPGPHVRIVAERMAQQLQRDRPLQVDMERAVDLAHPSGRDVRLDLKAIVEQGAGLEQELGQAVRVARSALEHPLSFVEQGRGRDRLAWMLRFRRGAELLMERGRSGLPRLRQLDHEPRLAPRVDVVEGHFPLDHRRGDAFDLERQRHLLLGDQWPGPGDEAGSVAKLSFPERQKCARIFEGELNGSHRTIA